MSSTAQFDHLIQFFKVLAEPNRLKIIGLLARQPHTVEQVAALLKVSASTASHHLSRLASAELVTARAESYYNVYSLKTDVLTSMARALLREAERPRGPRDQDVNDYDQKVLETFTTPEGRIRAFPAQEKKFLILLRHVLKAFDPGVRYTEKRVNQILGTYNEDTARLRRALVDHRFMAREGGGGKYWRIDM
jgi:DNA-binding transcriptional ArsR family regulator